MKYSVKRTDKKCVLYKTENGLKYYEDGLIGANFEREWDLTENNIKIADGKKFYMIRINGTQMWCVPYDENRVVNEPQTTATQSNSAYTKYIIIGAAVIVIILLIKKFRKK